MYDAIIEALKFNIKGIQLNEYKAYYENQIQNGDAIHNLLESLKAVKNFDRPSVGMNGLNNLKNRNQAIFSYDHCRAVKELNDESYINAVAVDSYLRKRGYILTQHPMTNTIEDFWNLVYKLNIKIIIMLDYEEHMKELNLPYYWHDSKEAYTIGPYTINLLKKESMDFFAERQMGLINSTSTELEPLLIHHYSFANDIWPIGETVPSEEAVLLKLKTKFTLKKNEQILIHCADGCSRSSILAATWYMLDVLKYESVVNVPLACRYVVDARPQAFENSKDLLFLYKEAFLNLNTT